MSKNSVWVSLESRTVRDYSEEGPYGSWSTDFQYEGLEVKLVGQGQIGWSSSIIETSFEAKVGQVVFAVIVVYSSGDSFGSSSGNTDVAGVYNTAETAYKVRSLIMYDNENNQRDFDYLKIEGEPDIYPGTWKGYFESLDSVRIETVLISA
jgi:hypothetical protein